MMKCYNCGYVWTYGGKRKYYVCCPQCMRQISLKKVARLATEQEDLPNEDTS